MVYTDVVPPQAPDRDNGKVAPSGAITAVSVGGGRPARLAYRPGLDGLRAVAVVAVMAQHAVVQIPGGRGEALPGGFLGVDVFFVISGFLITSLLLAEQRARGRIDLRSFWLRRARRLLPAVALTVAATGVLIAAADLPLDRASARGDALAALGYMANWRFVVTRQSYFAAFGLPSPFRHLWSLSLEEQWYLLFPPVLAVAAGALRRRPAVLVAGMVAAAGGSAVWMAARYRPGTDPSRVYYGTDTRAYTLLLGATLAAVAAFWPAVVARARPLLPVLAVGGAAALAVAFRSFQGSEAALYRGGLVGVALAAGAVVAGVGLPGAAGPVHWALGRRVPVAVGRISYGLYLWHWPIFVWLTPGRFGVYGARLVLLRFAVTFVVAGLSYRLVERPIRRDGWAGVRAGLARVGVPPARPAILTATAGVAVVATVVASTVGGGPVTPAPIGAASTLGAIDFPIVTVDVPPHHPLPAIPTGRHLHVVIGGDSVAWSLGAGLDDADAVPADVDIVTVANLGCTATPGTALNSRGVPQPSRCHDWRREWQAAAYRHHADLVLVLWGPWEVYDHLQAHGVLHPNTPEAAAAYRSALRRGVDGAVAAAPDARFAFLTVPCMHERNPDLGGDESPRNDPELMAWINRQTAAVAAGYAGRATTVDLGPLVCPGGRIVDRIGGVPVREDGVHFTPAITPVVWRYIMGRVRPWLAQPAISGPG